MQIINKLNYKKMKTNFKKQIVSGVLVAIMVGLAACSKNDKDFASDGYTSVIDVASDGVTLIVKSNLESVLTKNLTYSEGELDILLHMKEEEKLARDVYTVLYEKWGSQIFSNIKNAENNHMNAVILLLQSYGEDYTKVDEPGKFSNPVFQELYAQLMAKGSESIEEAYKTGALIEELDIKDLTEYLKEVTNENIIMVFENLVKGSRNHLRAFNRQLIRLGVTYTPVYISQEEYNQIVSTPTEAGSQYQMNRNGNKYGRRNGKN
jgi:hypothetical protein